MSALGDFLLACRERSGLSLKRVFEMTGISDSRLSKIERAQILLTPDDIRRLSELYKINIVSLYRLANYISDTDLKEYQYTFRDTNLLQPEEIEYIQLQIDFLNRDRSKLHDEF